MDALTQLIEPYVSSRANPLTDGICLQGLRAPCVRCAAPMKMAATAMPGGTWRLRSLCGGLALANAGLGAVHGFAGPFGGMYDAPHGAVCAALLAPVYGDQHPGAAQRARRTTRRWRAMRSWRRC